MMTKRSIGLAALLAGGAAGLGGCGENYSPNTYNAEAVQQANKVERGVIVGVRPVAVSAAGTIGAVAGGAAGGIAGSESPVGPVTRAFTTLGGTLVGGLVGTTAEHAVADTKAWEYIVREPADALVSVTQTDKSPLPIGLAVLVITGKQARIVPDYTVKLPDSEPVKNQSQPAALNPPT